MTKVMIIAVIIIAALLCLAVPYLLGFFKFGKTIIGSTFKKPSTLMYPVKPREWQERTRGAVSIVGEDCIGCGICAKACPTNAIEVDKAGGSWTIQRMQCIQCSACVDGCPKKCLTMENLYTIPDVVKVVDTFEIPAKAPKKAAGEAAAAAPADDGDLACDKEVCVFCGLCAKACPVDAIKVDRKEKVWEVDTDTCVKCGACIDKCPKKCLAFGGAAAAAAPAEEAKAAPAEEAKEAPAEEPAADDGDLACDKEACVFCGLCAKECPVDAITVDRKEKIWEVDTDTCVKCGACIDKCPKKCLSFGGAAAEEAPAEEAKEEAPAKRTIAAVDEDKCIGCNACVNECPSEAINDVVDNKWTLEEEKCVGCGACVDVCPTDAISMTEVE
ncbi:MAG: 4Fe-4S binding protein [Bacillota bacterium]|nr:4Fe-4S binding protein [Bacillota bacterium]